MRWARRATLILGAAHAMATALFLTLVITHAAHTGSWATTIRFNDYSEGLVELIAAWALLPALAWLIHIALKHELETKSASEPNGTRSKPSPPIPPRSLKTRTRQAAPADSNETAAGRDPRPPTPPSES